MIKQIKRTNAIQLFPILPQRFYDAKKDEEVYICKQLHAEHILTLPSKTLAGNRSMLGKEIIELTKALGADRLIFMGDLDLAWLRRMNTYPGFQTSLQYLADQGIGKRFNGALEVSLSELPRFIRHLSRLVSTNGIVQYVHFTDPEQHFHAELCQYGNLHLYTLDQTTDKLISKLLKKTSFIRMKKHNCYYRFSKNGRIGNRTITI